MLYTGDVAKVTSFRDLLVWQKAMVLAAGCYAATRGLKRDDQSVLGFEIRKSCVSIPSNIAEGFGRHHTAEYVHHLRYANASGNELQTQLELAHRAGLMREEEVALLVAAAEEVGRMLHGLIASLERGRP